MLVKKVVGGETTVYVGAHFEKNVTTGEVTKYYTLGDRRVAMRRGSTLTYLHGDHLGSASLATDAGGGVDDEMRYYPYGDTRSGTMATDRRFTGQREETAIGLYDYKARYYDPVLGRFIQADTIVAEPGNPQALNRYAYVYGNPLYHTDPSGHVPMLVTAGIGGLVGGAAGAVMYQVTVPKGARNSADRWVVVGTMAAAGTLVGTGVGIPAGVKMAATVSTVAIGTGVGMATGGGMELASNRVTGEAFEQDEFLLNAAGGAVSGAATAPIGGVGLAPTSVRSAVAGGVATLQYGAEQSLNGEPVTFDGGFTVFSAAAVGQFIGESVSIGMRGTPSQKQALGRLSLDDFQEWEMSPVYYMNNPGDWETELHHSTILAAGTGIRDTALSIGLDYLGGHVAR